MTVTDSATASSQDQPPSVLRTHAVPVIVGLVGLGMLITGVVLLLLPKPAPTVSEPKASVAIAAQVEKFATSYNTYDTTKDVDDYADSVSQYATKAFAKKFTKDVTGFFGELASTKQKSEQARLKSVAIEELGTSTARVLVAVDRSVSGAGLKEPVQLGQRGVVSLEKVGETWLVSDFEPIRADTQTDPGGPISEKNAGSRQGQGE